MKILVADDSPVIRTAVSVVLGEAGHDIVTASDGIEAIQAVYSELPDLIVLDIQMPKMTGYMTARLIKEDWSVAHIPILILTAHDSAEDRYWADKSGADGYLTKESLGDGLLSAIRSVHASRALSELSGGRQPDPQHLDQLDVLERVTSMLDRKLYEMTVVNDIVTLSTQAMDLRRTLGELLFMLRRFVAYDVAAIALADEKAVTVRVDGRLGLPDLDAFVESVVADLGSRMAVAAHKHEMAVWRADNHELPDAVLADSFGSTFTMVLRIRGEVLGVLSVASVAENAFPPAVVKTLRTVEHPITTVVDSAIHHRMLIEAEARRSLSSLYDS